MSVKKDDKLVCVQVIEDTNEEMPTIQLPDLRSNKPFGYHDQETGKTYFFQKLISKKFENKEILIAIPNEISISLSISKKSIIAAEKNLLELKKRSKKSDTIFDEDVKLAYDYLEEIQKSVVFSYKAVESFCNASIPDTYVYQKQSKKNTEHYNKDQIERWISTSEKISKIIPKILNCESPTQQKFWNKFTKLEEIRNSIIHSKSNSTSEMLTELFSKEIKDYITSSIDLLDYFVDLDPSNQAFPLGFNNSKVNVVSVKDAGLILSKIN